jgi:hypothetical protein
MPKHLLKDKNKCSFHGPSSSPLIIHLIFLIYAEYGEEDTSLMGRGRHNFQHGSRSQFARVSIDDTI